MGQLDQATARLQAALDRLEQAIESRASGDEPKLRRALNAARKENAALQEVAKSVAKGLDATIGRLKSALES